MDKHGSACVGFVQVDTPPQDVRVCCLFLVVLGGVLTRTMQPAQSMQSMSHVCHRPASPLLRLGVDDKHWFVYVECLADGQGISGIVVFCVTPRPIHSGGPQLNCVRAHRALKAWWTNIYGGACVECVAVGL